VIEITEFEDELEFDDIENFMLPRLKPKQKTLDELFDKINSQRV